MSSRPFSLVVIVVLGLAACPRSDSSVQADLGAAADAGVGDPELGRLRAQATSLSNDTRAWSRAVDTALWNHWTSAAPIDWAALNTKRDALLTTERLSVLRRALERGADDELALEHLSVFLEAEAVSRSATAEADAVATLESTLTFTLDGKDVRWGDLNRLLATEKSALKRKALWIASLPAAEKLDAALAARDAKRAEAHLATEQLLSQRGDATGDARLVGMLVPKSLLASEAEQRDVEPEAMRQVAEGLLVLTSEAWRLTLERLNQADTKLPMATLTRADLPRLMRVPAEVDLAFGKKELAPRAIATLGALGLYGKKGLTLDLSEAVKKNPLPLTVTPGGPADVRTSFRPLGGLRDQQLLLSELGVALALQHVTAGRFEYERLGDSALAQATGELFATLPGDAQWLESQGVPEAARPIVIDAWQVQRLFQARRAAAAFLVRLDCFERSDAQSRSRAAAIFTRALGVIHTEADMARMRFDSDDGLRSATTIRSMLMAEHVRGELNRSAGGPWFRSAGAGKDLVELWSTGSSVPLETRVTRLGAALTSFWQRSIEVTRVGVPVDGGVVIAPFPEPKGPVEVWTARPWPHARIGPRGAIDAGPPPPPPDARWIPKPWPLGGRRIAPEDAGVSASP
ncbi:MAG: hypothetical protein Q8L14_18665 [Myxococcales bacterium]|nr:hypothetical protein [Myxococcales bacterium]